MKYLVVGAGGTGGAMAAYLGKAGKDVTLIARGEHLAAMRENGLRLRLRTGDGETVAYIPAVRCMSAEEYAASGETPDVIWLCTKSYSVESIAPFLNRVAGNAMIIPILNGVRISQFVRRYVHAGRIIDGSIYIAAQKDGAGGVLMKSPLFQVTFGAEKGFGPETITQEAAAEIAADLTEAGAQITVSDDIVRDTVHKLSFTSPTAAVGIYFHDTIGGMQVPGPMRDMAAAMTREVQALGEAMGAVYDIDLAEAMLQKADRMLPDANASLQRDVEAGRENEFETLIIEPVRIGATYGLEMPTFREAIRKIGPTLGFPPEVE
ncbi:MAG: 2-dehydropantoate 2-reductase [Mogibacterium sp.]|nr:2-dehydropantoate 2-reductase [Mogibacterium sp.]